MTGARAFDPKRGTSVRGRWTDAVLENYYERASEDRDELQAWCYTDRLSYRPGDTVRFHVNTTASRYDLEIVRDGLRPEPVHARAGLAGRHHPTPDDCSVSGCKWPVAFELVIPDEWRSGAYRVRISAERGGSRIEHFHLFLVRPPRGGPTAPIVLVCATGTWASYNDWGGSNAYEGITGPNRDQYSPRLSLDRPWSRGFCWLPVGAPRTVPAEPPPIDAGLRYPHMEWAYANGYSKKYASAGWASYERHFAIWAEANAYRFDLATLHDLHAEPDLLAPYRCAVFVGHDEYWSSEMRDALDAWVEAGGHAARFAGNFMWQIRLEDAGRTQICYKYRARKEDPLYRTDREPLLTNAWEAPEVGRPGASTFGVNALEGIYAGIGGCVPRGAGGFTVYRPRHWAFAGADLYYGDILGARSRIFGYEVDGLDYTVRDGLPYPIDAGGAPAGLEVLAMGLATRAEADHGHGGSTPFIGDSDAEFIANLLGSDVNEQTLDRLRRGNGMIVHFVRGRGEVFTAATCEWVMGLTRRDEQVERVTRNVLNRFSS